MHNTVGQEEFAAIYQISLVERFEMYPGIRDSLKPFDAIMFTNNVPKITKTFRKPLSLITLLLILHSQNMFLQQSTKTDH